MNTVSGHRLTFFYFGKPCQAYFHSENKLDKVPRDLIFEFQS